MKVFKLNELADQNRTRAEDKNNNIFVVTPSWGKVMS